MSNSPASPELPDLDHLEALARGLSDIRDQIMQDRVVSVVDVEDLIDRLALARRAQPAGEAPQAEMCKKCHSTAAIYARNGICSECGGNEFVARPKPAAQQAAAPGPLDVETEMADRLRRIIANHPGGTIQVATKTLAAAADECDRFYNGMMAWKQTARKKDRDWNAERMERVNERCAARAATSAPGTPEAPASGVLCIGVAAPKGATVSVIQRKPDGTSTVLHGATHPVGDSMALLNLASFASFAKTAAAHDVLVERWRQVEAEGYDVGNDDGHVLGELGAYAAFYAMPPAARDWPAEETGYGATWGEAIVPADWTPPKPGDRRRELVKAGALVLAEIERMDRAGQGIQ